MILPVSSLTAIIIVIEPCKTLTVSDLVPCSTGIQTYTPFQTKEHVQNNIFIIIMINLRKKCLHIRDEYILDMLAIYRVVHIFEIFCKGLVKVTFGGFLYLSLKKCVLL